MSSLVSANGPSMKVELAGGEFDAGALRAWLETLTGEENARFAHFLHVFTHISEELLGRHNPGLGTALGGNRHGGGE